MYAYTVRPEVLAIGQTSNVDKLMPSEWDSSVIQLLAQEYAAAQEALAILTSDGTGQLVIPLPMPNLLYLILAVMLAEEQRSGTQVGLWKVFRLLAELQRLIEVELVSRASGSISRCELSFHELLLRVRS